MVVRNACVKVSLLQVRQNKQKFTCISKNKTNHVETLKIIL